MAKVPDDLRKIIGDNIRACRQKAFPGRGGGKSCAEALGVSPQQWSPWEKGTRTPDETSLRSIAKLFGVDVEYMRRDNTAAAENSAAPAPTVSRSEKEDQPKQSDKAKPIPASPMTKDSPISDFTGPEFYSYLYRNKVKVKFYVTVTYEVTDIEFGAA